MHKYLIKYFRISFIKECGIYEKQIQIYIKIRRKRQGLDNKIDFNLEIYFQSLQQNNEIRFVIFTY